MNPFVGELVLRALRPDELLNPAVQIYDVRQMFGFVSREQVRSITVPAGSLTDFASVPAIVRGLIDDDDPHLLMPSVVHDFLYARRGRLSARAPLSRLQCDRILREGMRGLGAPAWKQFAVYWAVRVGGRRHWGGG